MTMHSITITVSGKVQGVYFRQSTKEMALLVGISGEVKNKVDGSVFITATGTYEQLNQLIAWCRQGPTKARVTGIEVQDIDLQQFDGFSVRR